MASLYPPKLTQTSRLPILVRNITGLLVLLCWVVATNAIAQTQATKHAEADSFARSFFAQHCSKCHDTNTQKGDITLTEIYGSDLPSGTVSPAG